MEIQKDELFVEAIDNRRMRLHFGLVNREIAQENQVWARTIEKTESTPLTPTGEVFGIREVVSIDIPIDICKELLPPLVPSEPVYSEVKPYTQFKQNWDQVKLAMEALADQYEEKDRAKYGKLEKVEYINGFRYYRADVYQDCKQKLNKAEEAIQVAKEGFEVISKSSWEDVTINNAHESLEHVDDILGKKNET